MTKTEIADLEEIKLELARKKLDDLDWVLYATDQIKETDLAAMFNNGPLAYAIILKAIRAGLLAEIPGLIECAKNNVALRDALASEIAKSEIIEREAEHEQAERAYIAHQFQGDDA